MKKDLTQGNITKTMLMFACPMILGNLLQQCYNIADTLIVGRFLGPAALAGVGSAYTLMTFLTSIIIGLCMGSGTVISVWFGKKDMQKMKNSIVISFLCIAAITAVINLFVLGAMDFILKALHVPDEIYYLMRDYLWIIFFGIFFVFLYNYFAFLLRALGNSIVPLYFLGLASVINIVLDILFVVVLKFGIKGAAWATVIAQGVCAVGIVTYVWQKEPGLHPKREDLTTSKQNLLEILENSAAACVQQSVMNFGILMIQGLVNSFGTTVMAAFAAAVKIDSFAYMPAQEFGNAFSLFISQNFGGGKRERVQEGIKQAIKIAFCFCITISICIFILAPYLMEIFVEYQETEIIRTGVDYLRIEGSFYCGIGVLFLLYGFYRGIEKPYMSLILTILSLGTRVMLAYLLAPIPFIGVWGIWWAIPVGWLLADLVGIICIKGNSFYSI